MHRVKNNFLIIIFILSSLIFVSCDDTLTVEDIDNKPIPATNVSFSQHIYPVFNVKCNNSGCHNDENRAGGVSLTSWSNATDPNIVVVGQPDNSRLVWSIENRPGISLMPPLPLALTPSQIQGIRTWIKEGALNN